MPGRTQHSSQRLEVDGQRVMEAKMIEEGEGREYRGYCKEGGEGSQSAPAVQSVQPVQPVYSNVDAVVEFPVISERRCYCKCCLASYSVWQAAKQHHQARIQDMQNYDQRRLAWMVVNDEDLSRPKSGLEGSQVIYDIPLKWLATSGLLTKLFEDFNEDDERLVARDPKELKQVSVPDFHNFYRWIHGGQISRLLQPVTARAIDDNLHRLIAAVKLGIFLDCAEYQLAAMTEFIGFKFCIEAPEVYVEAIWNATEEWAAHDVFAEFTDKDKDKERIMHPMRKLIVALAVARTAWTKRGREKSDGKANLKCCRRKCIQNPQFWEMYDDSMPDARGMLEGNIFPSGVEQFL